MNHKVYFYQILHTQLHIHITGMCNSLFDGRGFTAGCDQLVKMLITLEPHGIFGSKCAYLFNIVQPLGGNPVKRLCRASF